MDSPFRGLKDKRKATATSSTQGAVVRRDLRVSRKRWESYTPEYRAFLLRKAAKNGRSGDRRSQG